MRVKYCYSSEKNKICEWCFGTVLNLGYQHLHKFLLRLSCLFHIFGMNESTVKTGIVLLKIVITPVILKDDHISGFEEGSETRMCCLGIWIDDNMILRISHWPQPSVDRTSSDWIDEENSIDNRSEERSDLEVDLMGFFSEFYESRCQIESPVIGCVFEESDRRADSFDIAIVGVIDDPDIRCRIVDRLESMLYWMDLPDCSEDFGWLHAEVSSDLISHDNRMCTMISEKCSWE